MTEEELVVVDTNNLVSGLLMPRGNEGRLLDLIQRERVKVAVSPEVLAEYRTVLTRPKFRFDLERVAVLIGTLEHSLIVLPTRRLQVSPHEADNRFLEYQESASAAYLITGNARHFPSQYGVTRIVRAAEDFQLTGLA